MRNLEERTCTPIHWVFNVLLTLTFLLFNKNYSRINKMSKVSFRDIVSEEYALKVGQEEENDPELLLALRLSEESHLNELQSRESENQAEEEAKNNENQAEAPVVDEDFIYALQLQEKFDSMQEEENIKYMQARNRENGLAKITVSYEKKFRSIPKHQITEEYEDDDDDDDEYGSYMNDVSVKNPNKPSGRMNYKAYQNSDRVSSKKDIITKHDPQLSGLTNASNLDQKLIPNFGNLSDLNIPISNKVYSSLKNFADRAETRRIRFHGKEGALFLNLYF